MSNFCPYVSIESIDIYFHLNKLVSNINVMTRLCSLKILYTVIVYMKIVVRAVLNMYSTYMQISKN